MKKGLFRIGTRNRVLFCASLGFLAGCVLRSFFNLSWIFALSFLAFALAAFLLRLAGKKATAGLFLAFLSLGCLRTGLALNPTVPEEGTYEITATVSGYPTVRSETRQTLCLCSITLDGVPVAGKAYFTLNTAYLEEEIPELSDGLRISFRGRVYHPQEKSGKYHFDFRHWMLMNGYSFGISTYELPTLCNDAASAPVTDLSARIRKSMEDHLQETMGDNGRLVSALVLGDRSGLEDGEYASFQKLGIAHVMSVSGLHIGILAGMLMALMEKLKWRRLVRLPVLAVFLLGYSWLTGFSSSSLRAALMFLTLFGCRSLFRAPDRLTALALAALLILLLNPLQAVSAGFVLSFSAMLGIYALTNPVQEKLDVLFPTWELKAGHSLPALLHNFYRKFQRGIKAGFSLSLGAQIGVLLPTVYFFHQLPLYGLLMNLILVPLIGSVLTPLFLLTAVLSYVPGIGSLMGSLSSLGVDSLLGMIGSLSQLPGAVLRVPSPSVPTALGLGATLVLLTRLIPLSRRKRLLSASCCGLLTLALTLVTLPPSLRYVQLSVGQADCGLLTDGKTTVLIDTGEDGTEAADVLLAEGRNIDFLILTHLHLDHCGGVGTLLEEGISIGKVLLPEGAEEQQIDDQAREILATIRQAGIPIETLAAGDTLSFSNSSLEVLWPQEGKVRSGGDPNDMSLVLQLHFGDYRILLAADVTTHYEMYAAQGADVLKVAHHGSSASTGTEFLQAVSPTYALLSCQSGARLPAADTLNRLEEQGVTLLRTDQGGDITLTLNRGQLQLTPYRKGAVP